MASVFYDSIFRAYYDDNIVAAGPIDDSVPSACDKKYGNGIYAGGLTQKGYGKDDGIYFHESMLNVISFSHNSPWDRDQWRFARLFSQNYDDILAWVNDSPSAGKNSYIVWRNSADGKGKFTVSMTMPVDLFCNPAGINFIDMNGMSLVHRHPVLRSS
jgi:hypothetical protein